MKSNQLKQLARRIIQTGLPVPGLFRPLIRGFYRLGVWGVETYSFLHKLLFVEPVLRSVCEGVGCGLRAERLPYIRGHGRLRLGDRVNLSGRSSFYFMRGMAESPSIEIGDDTFVGNGCTLSAARRIRVGAHCLLAAGVRIHDNDGHPLSAGRRMRHEPIVADEAADVVVGDNVWIGAGAVILKGVTIGAGSVVGASSVVTGAVPPQTIVAGNPARVVGVVPE